MWTRVGSLNGYQRPSRCLMSRRQLEHVRVLPQVSESGSDGNGGRTTSQTPSTTFRRVGLLVHVGVWNGSVSGSGELSESSTRSGGLYPYLHGSVPTYSGDRLSSNHFPVILDHVLGRSDGHPVQGKCPTREGDDCRGLNSLGFILDVPD